MPQGLMSWASVWRAATEPSDTRLVCRISAEANVDMNTTSANSTTKRAFIRNLRCRGRKSDWVLDADRGYRQSGKDSMSLPLSGQARECHEFVNSSLPVHAPFPWVTISGMGGDAPFGSAMII